MKYSYKYHQLVFHATVLFCTLSIPMGCKKMVQVSAPDTQLVATTVFSTASTATSAQVAIYSQMVNGDYPYWVDYFLGLSADELMSYPNSYNSIQFYTNALNAVNSSSSSIWSAAYNFIYQANAVIAGLQGATGIDTAIKKQLTAEALFTRAFWHFYLVNLFGEVPIVTTPDYSVVATLKRSPTGDVYQQIIMDLKSAQSSLNPNYVDVTDTTVSQDRVRPNQYAATALLARAYLYSGDYADAALAATSVINYTSLYGLDTLNGVFEANSPEAIWELMPGVPGYNTPEGENFILTSSPQSGTNNSSTISSELLGAFEPGDSRRTAWIDSIVANGNIYYFPFKYKVQSSSNLTEYSVVLRLAEQYLIRAEAEAMGASGGLSAAIIDVDKVRARAGLGGLPAQLTQQQLLSAILHERQVELFTEWGHRWLDLKRFGMVDAIMGGATGVCAAKGGQWVATDSLYPIPQTDRNNDPNLTQNAGY